MIHLFLDDCRRCPEGFVLAQNAQECIALLEMEQVGILSLDYDLGWEQPTGLEVARYIAESGKYPKEIYLHSSSLEGRQNMYKLLSECLPEGRTLVFSAMSDEVLERAAERK